MSAGRQARSSEDHLSSAIGMMRSLDKIVWLGEAGGYQDVEAYVGGIKSSLDSMVASYREEIKPELVANRLKQSV